MEHESTFLRLQEPATFPYPGSDQSSPCPLSHVLYIHLIFIFPSTLGSSKSSFSYRSPNQNPVSNSPILHTCHMPRPSDISCLYLPNDIVLSVHMIDLTVIWSWPLPPHLVPLPSYPTQQPILKHVLPKGLPHCHRPIFSLIHNTTSIITFDCI